MTFLAAILALASAALGAGAAAAQTQGEYSGRLVFRLSNVNPVVVTADGTGLVTFTGRYTNSGADTIDDIQFRFQRGPALDTPAAVIAEANEPSQPSAVVTEFKPLPGTLAAGDSAPFAISVPVFPASAGSDEDAGSTGAAGGGEGAGSSAGEDAGSPGDAGSDEGAGGDEDDPGSSTDTRIDGLDVTEPGVYPVMVNVNATVHVGEATAVARVGELHLLLTVASVPGTAPGSGGTDPSATSTPVTVLWPLVSTPHLGVGDVFHNDDLAKDLTTGGRVATAINALQATGRNPDLVTIVVDPMLLDEMQRMSDGYRVLATPDTAQDRLHADGTIPRTVPGAGQAAATAYLDELRTLAARHQVLVLPYGDADLSALVRSGMSAQAGEAVTRGRDIATRVLVRGPLATSIYANLVTDIAAPPDGAMTDETAGVLAGLGDRAAILAPGSATGTNGKPLAAGLVTISSETDAYDDFPAVLTGGSRAAQFAEILGGKTPPSTAAEVSLLAAELAAAPASAHAPIVVLPPRQLTANRAGLAALSHLVDDLAESGTLVPTRITTLLGFGATTTGGSVRTDAPTGGGQHQASTPAATLSYSAANRRSELPIGYLREIDALRQRIAALDTSLVGDASGADGADPRLVLRPLADALLPAVSASWRATPDPAAGSIETIDATLVWLYGGVQISRDAGSYTLASSTAPLLLTVKNTLPYQVSVTVAIVGGARAGLDAKDSGPITIGAGPRSMPVKLDTVVSRSGTFTVYAQLYTEGGAPWAGPVPLTIDSRAYGALTVILMATASGVLVLMVIWRLVQRVRGRIDDPDDAILETSPSLEPSPSPTEAPSD